MHALTILCKLAGKFLSSFTLNIYSLRWLKVWWLQELLSRSKWSMWCASPKNDLTTATALPLWQLLQFTGLMLSRAPLQGMLKIRSAVLRWPNKNVVCNLIHTHTHKKKKPGRERCFINSQPLWAESGSGLCSRIGRCDPLSKHTSQFLSDFH